MEVDREDILVKQNHPFCKGNITEHLFRWHELISKVLGDFILFKTVILTKDQNLARIELFTHVYFRQTKKTTRMTLTFLFVQGCF